MPSLTNGEIQKALKRVKKTGKQETLLDGEGRGTGRLALVLKAMPTRVTADWMAQQWRDDKRIKKKLGSYPSMSLALAREIFQRDFASMIQKGRSIKIVGDTRPGTVADLFEAYVKYLKDQGKPSWKEAEKGLNKIADALGRNRPAREIEPDEIVEVIRPIYERGKKSMADHVRSYVHAAYNWGLKSEHDYRSASQRRFRLVYNPEFRQSRRTLARAGSTKTSSFGFTAGLNVRTLPSIHRTQERCAFSCSLASGSKRLPACMLTTGMRKRGSSTGRRQRMERPTPFPCRLSPRS